MSQTIDTLEPAREAAGRLAWRDAYDRYAALDTEALPPDDLENYAEAAWWTGKPAEAINLRELAYAAFASAGRKRDAARVAITLSWDESGRGAFSVSHGWLATATRILEAEPDSAEHARLALTRAVNAMFAEGDSSAAIEAFDRAY